MAFAMHSLCNCSLNFLSLKEKVAEEMAPLWTVLSHPGRIWQKKTPQQHLYIVMDHEPNHPHQASSKFVKWS